MPTYSLTVHDLDEAGVQNALNLIGGTVSTNGDGGKKTKKAKAEAEPVSEAPAEEAEAEEPRTTYTEKQLAKFDRAKLVEIGDDLGIETKSKRVPTLIAGILAAQEAATAEAEEEFEADDEWEEDEGDEDTPVVKAKSKKAPKKKGKKGTK